MKEGILKGITLFLLFVTVAFAGGKQVFAEGSKPSDPISLKEGLIGNSYSLGAEESVFYKMTVKENGEYFWNCNFSEKDCYARLVVNGETVISKFPNYSLTTSRLVGKVELKKEDDVLFIVQSQNPVDFNVEVFSLAEKDRVEVVANSDKGWSYDEKTNTLTLDGYNGGCFKVFDRIAYAKNLYGGMEINEDRVPLNVVIKGENYIDGGDINSSYDMYFCGFDVNMTGDGVLNISSEIEEDCSQSGIQVLGSLVVDGPVINFNGVTTAIFIYSGGVIQGIDSQYASAKEKNAEFTSTFTMKSGVINVNIKPVFAFSVIDIYNSCIYSEGAIYLKGGFINLVGFDFRKHSSGDGLFKSDFSRAFADGCKISVFKRDPDFKIRIVENSVEEEADLQEELKYDVYLVDDVVKLYAGFKLDKTEFEYSGNEIKPAVTSGDGMVQNVTYYVIYKDNVNPGTGKAVVKGIVDKDFEQVLEFSIKKKGDQSGSDDEKKTVNEPGAGDEFPVEEFTFDNLKVGMLIKCPSVNGIYKVTKISKKGSSVSGGKLEYVSPIKKNKKTFKIVDYAKINGAKFKVTSIGKKAFGKCKKIKSVKIRSKRVLKFSKASFYGISKKVVNKARKIKLVVKKKFSKKYKKLLKKKGLSKKVRV